MSFKEVTRWQTEDGEEHHSLDLAQAHAKRLEETQIANSVLGAGGTVAEAIRAAKWDADSAIDSVLARVTAGTKLVIPHWQCRDTPGYQVQCFRSNRKVFVWGNAGAWTGPFGADISVADLARYARHEATIF